VYKAHDIVLDRYVALKVVHHEAPEFAPLMMRREARTLARLAPHPGVVSIFEAGAIHGRAFIAVEYLPHSLDQYLLQHPNGLPVAYALAIGVVVSWALGHAHANGVIHRDVKPASILFDESRQSIRLSGFNLASVVDSESGMASPGSHCTPKYMAPEQRDGLPLQPSTDVYALGITLRELLLGYRAQAGRQFPERVEACLEKATQENPADRYANGATFAEALKHAGAEIQTSNQSLATIRPEQSS
jgi:serine/threonine-protein kinase